MLEGYLEYQRSDDVAELAFLLPGISTVKYNYK
jgi:hypothetical protein